MSYTLNYTKEKGLRCENGWIYYKDNVIRSHEEKGFKVQLLEIPEEHIKVGVEANFGYGNASYLRAGILYNNHRLLDFDIEKLSLLNDNDLFFFFCFTNCRK